MVWWNRTPCSLVNENRSFGETHCYFRAEMKIGHSPLELVPTYQAIRRHSRKNKSIISSIMNVVNSSACNQIWNNSIELNCAILICQPLTNNMTNKVLFLGCN